MIKPKNRGSFAITRFPSGRTTIAVAAICALIAVGCAVGSGPPSISLSAAASPSTAAVPAQTIEATPPPLPSPTGLPPLLESGGGRFPPGTYSTHFQPTLIFTMTPGLSGEVDANEPAWIGIELGFDPLGPNKPGTWSADVMVTRLDQVIDRDHPGSYIDAPSDLVAWIKDLPGLTVIAPPKAVKIGGLDATQLDVRTGDAGVLFGPIPGVDDPPSGLGPLATGRLSVVRVDGHDIVTWLGAQEQGSAHFARVVETLQPIIDALAWPDVGPMPTPSAASTASP